MTRIEEIREAMAKEFKLQGIEDTPQHRLWFLEGLRDGWLEDSDSSIEKTFYIVAINLEILRLQVTLDLS